MNIVITDNYSDALEYSCNPVTVILECDDQEAELRYSLNGRDPARYGVTYHNPFIISERPSREVILKAVAIKDNIISDTVSRNYVFIDPMGDEDKDGLSNLEEGIQHNQDSDGDGIPDFLDEDSNNDGIPDSIQLRRDWDKDGIPDRIQVREDKFQIIVDSDLYRKTEVVENYPYHISIRCINGSGVVDIRNNGMVISHPSSYVELLGPELPVFMEAGTEVNYIFMVSQCRRENRILLQYTAYDAESDGLDSDTICNAEIVTETDDLPYAGIRISWSTDSDAVSYIIQKDDNNFYVEIPAVDYRKVDMQWYIDRKGGLFNKYSVAYRNRKGKIGPFTLPKHAPDLHEGKCLLQGNVVDIGLNPIKGIPVAHRVVSIGKSNLIGNTIVVKSTYFTYTSEDGSFEMEVPQNSIVKIKIDEAGYDRNFAIPCSRSADLRYLDAMPNNNL